MLDINQLSSLRKATYVFQNIQLAIGILGLIGNVLILIVCSGRSLRKHSYSFYIRAMAVSDSIIMLHSFRVWSKLMFADVGGDLDLVAPFFCSFDEFQAYVAGGTSFWILMFISIDRLVSIVYSNRFGIFKKRWFQAFLVVLAVIVNSAVSIHMPLYNQIIIIQVGSQEIKMCTMPPAQMVVSSWILFANLILIVFVANNLINFRLIIYIAKSRQKIVASLNGNGNQSNDRPTAIRDRKFARTTIGLDICCFLSKLPLVTALLVAQYVPMSLETTEFIFTLAITLASSNNGISFIVNMKLNSIFYQEFIQIKNVGKFFSIKEPTIRYENGRSLTIKPHSKSIKNGNYLETKTKTDQ